MGRFYDGDIQGKFWFGIQDSNDVENLVTINSHIYYSWKACNCVAEIVYDNYCRQCYKSLDEHIEAAIEEEEYEDKCLYYEECYQGYSLDKDTYYDELIENMKLLKKEIPEEIIKIFEKIEQNDNILDAFTGIFDDTHKPLNNIEIKNEQMSEFVARYTLGYQIEYCLRTRGTCNINCEY
jgi:type I restriction-modification system DNA methylase subunit